MMRLRKSIIAVFIAAAALLLCAQSRAELLVMADISGEDDSLDSAIQDNIRAHLSADNLPCSTSERSLLRALRKSGDEISRAMRALGYYHSSWKISHKKDSRLEEGISKKLINKRQDCWKVRVVVTPGEPVRMTQVDVKVLGEASTDPVFQDYLNELPAKVGQQLNHAAYEDIKKGLNQRARNFGYFEAKLDTHTLEIDTDTNQANISISFDSGPRYHFGAVTFSASPLGEPLLERFLPFQIGEAFNNNKLIEFQSKLVSSGYFDSVSVDQQTSESDAKTVPIAVTTTPKTRYETTAGIGASTDTGPRLSYGLRNRRVNPDGDTYQVSSQLSPVQSNLGFQYSQPRANPLTEKLQWSTGIETEDTDTVDSTSFQAKVALIDETSSNWLQTTSLKFLREDYEVSDVDRSSILLIPEIAWTKSQSNNPRYPTKGWRITAAVRGAVKEVVSDISMAQVETDAKLILPLWGGRLISRAGFGATALDEFDELPASLRFFAGGDNSVRGFGYKDLGPEDDEGEVIGGQHRITASMEYDHKVWRDFALATFYDVGNAFDSEDFTLYHSAGIGIRWFSPIGPIRIDLAFPLKDGSYRIHLSMGPDL